MWILNSTDSLALKDIISKKPEILAGSCNNKLHIRCVSTHPAKQPSAAVFWRGYHKLLHYSPHKTSAPPLLPHCHQQRQSEGASDPHSPASSAGTQWVLLPLHKHRQQQEKMQTCRFDVWGWEMKTNEFVIVCVDMACTSIQRTVSVALGSWLCAAQCRGILPSLSGMPMLESCLIRRRTCSGRL